METQKLKAKEEGDKEKERLGKGLLAKDREIRALQTGMGVKRQEIAKLERNGDSLRNNVERMEKERAALCKKVECEEKQNKELNDTMLSQEIEIQGLRRKLVSKTEIAKEMETKVKELKTKVGKWKAHTTTLLSCLREEEQRSWSKLPITGSLYHYLGSWYSSDKSVVTATEALKGFLRSEGIFI
ncbi:hypothetical protein EYC80_004947 [Monilinia laxa]|nr:hypothetical protein EYC80_004947 [Monilinia laxa]